MNNAEMVTDFKMEGSTVADLCRAINEHLKRLGLEPDEYNFSSTDRGQAELPGNARWLVAFAVEGGNEGYYVHIGGATPGWPGLGTYDDLAFCKTYDPDNAYAIAREAQRFLTAARWN